MSCLLRCLPLLVLGWSLSAAEAVPLGAGSLADGPPLGEGKFRTAYEEPLHLHPSLAGRPVPTNDWWTHLAISGTGGMLWAYPAAVRFVDHGVDVFLPTAYNQNGDAVDPGPALELRSARPPGGKADRLLADFEGSGWPSGWTTSGTAFGDGPAPGALQGQSAVSGFSGRGFASSYHGGDRGVGTLTSATFTIDRGYLHAQIAGGNHPGGEEVRLIIDQQTVRTATADNSGRFHWFTWDVREFAGRSAKLVLVDELPAGWAHLMLDTPTLSDQAQDPEAASQAGFSPTTSVLRYGDWTVTARQEESEQRRWDVTFGRGLPFAWIECRGVAPRLRSAAGVQLVSDDPSHVPLLHVGDAWYGLYGPTGMKVSAAGGEVAIEFPAGATAPWLALGFLADRSQAGMLAPAAGAIPRESRFDFTYDPQAGAVSTTFTLSTDKLRPDAGEPLQGWLTHHLHAAHHDLTEVGAPYPVTPRGPVHFARGAVAHFTWDFSGVIPVMPLPTDAGFDRQRMAGYLRSEAEHRTKKPFRDDTYWGGKDLELTMHYALMAQQLGDANAAVLAKLVRERLADWCTYSGAGDKHYFARYPRWGAVVGFQTSFGSELFTDNHFHYGYLTTAAGMLGLMDPDVVRQYGPVLRTIARQYANWERDATDLPYLRCFDPWGGHSYAGGSSSGGGNNQESTSEAMQSWGGLVLLGTAIGDEQMVACGAMGYAIEGEAVRTYWNNYHAVHGEKTADVWPPGYHHGIVGILGDSGQAFGTFFNGEPQFIYGIQWLPATPLLSYLGRDPAFVRTQFDRLLVEQAKAKPGFTLASYSADWGNVALQYLAFGRPAEAVAEFDRLAAAKHAITTGDTAGVTYWLAHAGVSFGTIDPTAHVTTAGSMVLQTPAGARTAVVWNPGAKPATFAARNGTQALGSVTAAPGLTAVALKP
jgi:hypothetical protein